MPHMVIYRSAEGMPAYHQADSLDDAVRFVEHVRNNEHVPEARIFAMHEVLIEFKTYYRVEVASPEPGAGRHDGEPAKGDSPSVARLQPKPVVAVADTPAPSPVDPKHESATVAVNAGGRFGLFGKG